MVLSAPLNFYISFEKATIPFLNEPAKFQGPLAAVLSSVRLIISTRENMSCCVAWLEYSGLYNKGYMRGEEREWCEGERRCDKIAFLA